MKIETACTVCKAPDRRLWPVSIHGMLERICDCICGAYAYLSRCRKCQTLWFGVLYEPYEAFPYQVLWPYSQKQWENLNNKVQHTQLLQWHALKVWELSAPTSPKGAVMRVPEGTTEEELLRYR